jgi:acetyl-CoA/propionyl-CoA carboxylase biotin carboxyl carrier protein
VEAQVLADTHGNIIVVGTRDCSLQRRHQKLVEEAPAPFLTEDQRRKIYAAAKAICAQVHYVGAGTVEFLVSADGAVAFLEVNTRLQVEHPVTEETSGIDLVQAQFRIAAGEPLEQTEDPLPRGHSFEFRINAEDVGRGFLPSPGIVKEFSTPSGPGIRLDTGVREGSVVPAQFDSLLAKLIVTGADRQQALRRARRALAEFQITGLATVLSFHRAVINEPDFTSTRRLGIHTRWIETDFDTAIAVDPEYSPTSPSGDRRTITVELDGRRHAVGLPAELLDGWARSGRALAEDGNRGVLPAEAEAADDGAADERLISPMTGTVVKWLAEPGAELAAGDPVVVLEAMKMETAVAAHRGGKLAQVVASPGTTVNRGEVLAIVN